MTKIGVTLIQHHYVIILLKRQEQPNSESDFFFLKKSEGTVTTKVQVDSILSIMKLHGAPILLLYEIKLTVIFGGKSWPSGNFKIYLNLFNFYLPHLLPNK